MEEFGCGKYSLKFQPNYDIQKIINSLNYLRYLQIELNVTKLPTNFLIESKDQRSLLNGVAIKSQQNLTIKSGAFQLNKSNLL